MTLIVSLMSLMPCAQVSGEWKAKPIGYVLTEPSIVGSVEDGRNVVETVKGLESRIEATEKALERIEEQVRIGSVAQAQAQKEIKEIPNLLEKAEEDFKKTLRKEKAKSTGTGIVLGLLAAGGAMLLF